MKLACFLQTVKEVPLGYNFRLYTYGPYDGDGPELVAWFGWNLFGGSADCRQDQFLFSVRIAQFLEMIPVNQRRLEKRTPVTHIRTDGVINRSNRGSRLLRNGPHDRRLLQAFTCPQQQAENSLLPEILDRSQSVHVQVNKRSR
jgi:hypothetical protein